MRLCDSDKYLLTTVGSSFLYASQGTALIHNGLFVGLLPKALGQEDFISKLIFIHGGAFATFALSEILKGRFSVSLEGLAAQTTVQMVIAYFFIPPPPSKKKLKLPLDPLRQEVSPSIPIEGITVLNPSSEGPARRIALLAKALFAGHSGTSL